MTWSEVRAAFERLVGEPTEMRERRLSQLDPELAAEVRMLLESDSTAAGFLERSRITAPRAVTGPAEGTRLGHFALVRPLGSGGMGVVWEAQQESPSRRVALKILTSSGWSRAERWRFEYEAQVLASLGHPSIARLYEAGSEAREGGELSWFAMELVEDARDLLSWADEEDADRERRLAHFADLCEAVQYGHRRGVIHRDLKPANVLVGKDGRLKLIDFGVARAVEGSEATPSLRTQTGEIVGTLQYMAPEQVAGRGREVDVRSDVYSMGVILYRLLVGVPPFDLTHASLASIARIVLEEEPRRPSEVRRELAGDLEWVLLKALEKDPARRYQSVAELAEDLRRFEEHRPVLAHTPSALYRLEKFVRRNRAVVAIALTAVLGAAATIWGITSGMLRARDGERAALLASQEAGKQTAIAQAQEERAFEQQQIAELEARRNRRVLELVEGLFEGIDERTETRELKVVDLLDKKVLALEHGPDLDPDTEFVLRIVLGKMYTGLRVFGRAREELERGLALYPSTRRRESDRAREIEARAYLGYALTQLGKPGEGVRLMNGAFAEIEQGEFDVDVEDAQVGLLIHLHDRGQFDELRDRAASLRAFAARTTQPGLELRAMFFQAMALSGLGCIDDAVELHEALLRDCDSVLGERHWQSVEALVTYSRVLQQAKRDVEAEALLARAIPLLNSVHGPTHPLTLGALNNRAVLADSRGNDQEAAEWFRELVEAYDSLESPHVLGLMTALNNLGNSLVAVCEYDEAEPILRRAVELSRSATLGPSLKGPQVRFNHGACLAAMMRWEEAEPLLLENYEIFRDLLGPEHELVRSAAKTIAVACDRNGYPEEAESWRQGP